MFGGDPVHQLGYYEPGWPIFAVSVQRLHISSEAIRAGTLVAVRLIENNMELENLLLIFAS